MGRVQNTATGDFLSSARLSINGTNLSTMANSDGTFYLTVPSGKMTLVASYTGLDTQNIPIEVGAGETVTEAIGLNSDRYVLGRFVVTGVREGNAAAIQAQRVAPNLKTVVATDAYGMPATNPGELLQRLAGVTTDIIAGEVRSIYIRGMGPEYSSVMIDGVSVAGANGLGRGVQIDQYGTANIKTVELIKAPTPDQDANAIAGFINLVSKRGFDQVGRRITLSAGVSWRDRGFSGSPFQDRADDLDQFSFSYSNAFSVLGGKKNLGVAINYSRRLSVLLNEENGGVFISLGSQHLNPVSDAPLTRQFATGDYQAPAKANTLGANFDYKISEDTFVYANFTATDLKQQQQWYRFVLGNAGANAALFAPGSTFANSTLLPSVASTGNSESGASTANTRTYGVNTGLETKLFNRTAVLTVRANYSHGDSSGGPFMRANAITFGPGIGFQIDRTNRDLWEPAITQTSGPSIYDPASYHMRTISRGEFNIPNDVIGGSVDFTKYFETAAPTYIKVGIKYNKNSRDATTNYKYYTFVGADGVIDSADDSLAPYSPIVYKQTNGQYGPFPFMPVSYGPEQNSALIPANLYTQTAADVYNSYDNSERARQDLSEGVSAAYVSVHVDLGKLRVLAGLRVEKVAFSGNTWVRNQTAAFGGNNVGGLSLDPVIKAENLARAKKSFVSRLHTTGKYQNVFPGLHFIYEPGNRRTRGGFKDLLIRASYNKSISRPPVSSILPVATENLTSTSVTLGNPNLKPYFSDNFDLSVEKYFEPIGLFSAGVFLKEIKDYIRSLSYVVGPEGIDGNGLYAGYTASNPVNAGSARVRGFELSYQQQFTFLPGALKGLGTFANFTYTDTLGNFGALTTQKRLPLLTPRSGNAGVSYVMSGWQVRLMANWRDRVYASTAVVDAARGYGDLYRASRVVYDLKIQYRINARYDLYFDAVNFTNEATREDSTNNGLTFIKLNPGAAYSIGVIARF